MSSPIAEIHRMKITGINYENTQVKMNKLTNQNYH